MTPSSNKRTLSLVIGLTFMAALLWASVAGGRTSTLQDPTQPTLVGPYYCDDSDGYRVAFTWTRRMPGNGAWLGNVVVHQGTRQVLNKPIQVFDGKPPEKPIDRQFQAQDGSFYCSRMTVPDGRRSVSWEGCRNWLLADQTCVRRRPGEGTGDTQP